ncbi:formate dehydrogenase accessory sulfurtransferase FdhD [Thalassotalea fusca]
MPAIKKITKFRYRHGKFEKANDSVIVEQPLQVVISPEIALAKPIVYTITYRTPGEDGALITGLLLSEGVIKSPTDIIKLAVDDDEASQNRWNVQLTDDKFNALELSQKYQPTYSSCGLCGSTSIKQFETKHDICLSTKEAWLNADDLNHYAEQMKQHQSLFAQTGGNHAASLFDINGKLITLHEDIGRHNALDKLLGHLAINCRKVDLHEAVIVLSSRISLEMVQKTLVAGIPVLVAVGGASSLAIDAANRFGLTLIGFVSVKGFNVYSGHQRLTV